MELFCAPGCIGRTVDPNDITGARWKHSHQEYVDFQFFTVRSLASSFRFSAMPLLLKVLASWHSSVLSL